MVIDNENRAATASEGKEEEDETCMFCIKGKVAVWWKKNAKVENAWFAVACVIIGICLGLIVNASVEPGSEHGKRWAFWLGFPGAMFLRAIKCLVIPLIFCSMVAGVAELVSQSKTSSVGKQTVCVYLFTTFCASIEGLIWIVIFKSSFIVLPAKPSTVGAEVTLQCPEGGLVTSAASGALSCGAVVADAASTFMLNNLDGKIGIKGSLPKKSFEDAVVSIFHSLVPSNLLTSCLNGDILAVITFAIFFGLVAAALPGKQNNVVMSFFVQLSLVFQIMITAVVGYAPFAITSLIISTLALQDDLKTLLINVGLLTLCCTLGFFFHIAAVMTPMFKYFVGEFPLEYVKQIVPAYAFAFACASSAATLPLTMKCVDRTRTVSLGLRKFILTLGATVNMDGSAIYFPCAIVFIAITGGHADLIDAKTLFLCVMVSSLGSMGASPIPNSGLVMLVTIWDTTFPGIPIPPQVAYVQAIDFFIDRMVTVTNVMGDTFVTRIVQSMQGKITKEELRQLEEEISMLDKVDDDAKSSLESSDSVQTPFSEHNRL